MNEQASQNSTADASDSSQEATPNHASATPQSGTPEDSREAATKKAEADSEFREKVGVEDNAHQWKQELKRFHDNVNEVLASKENLKLKTLSIKTRPEFFQEWTRESRQYMILMVNLKRRLESASNSDQKTSTAA
jgi:hypothetical protein